MKRVLSPPSLRCFYRARPRAPSLPMTTGAANAQVTIAPEQRTKIKSYITTQNIKPVTVKEKVVVGATLPADVTSLAVPADRSPGGQQDRYVSCR